MLELHRNSSADEKLQFLKHHWDQAFANILKLREIFDIDSLESPESEFKTKYQRLEAEYEKLENVQVKQIQNGTPTEQVKRILREAVQLGVLMNQTNANHLNTKNDKEFEFACRIDAIINDENVQKFLACSNMTVGRSFAAVLTPSAFVENEHSGSNNDQVPSTTAEITLQNGTPDESGEVETTDDLRVEEQSESVMEEAQDMTRGERESSVLAEIIVSQSPESSTTNPLPEASGHKRPSHDPHNDPENPKRPRLSHSAPTPEQEIDPENAKPPISDDGTIDFSCLYHDGGVVDICEIVAYPENSGKFYILQCHTHKEVFQKEPWTKARDHIREDNKSPRGGEAKLIELYGVRVRNCDAASVNDYNRKIAPYFGTRHRQSQNSDDTNGHRPVLRQGNYSAETQCQQPSPKRPAIASYPPARRSSGNPRNSNQGRRPPLSSDKARITRPRSDGTLYIVTKDGHDYAVMVLPMNGSFRVLGIPGTIHVTPLVDDLTVPDCYDRNDQSGKYWWAAGYNDGEKNEHLRTFPVAVFDNARFPQNITYEWVSADRLKTFNHDYTSIMYNTTVHDFICARRNRAVNAAASASNPEAREPVPKNTASKAVTSSPRKRPVSSSTASISNNSTSLDCDARKNASREVSNNSVDRIRQNATNNARNKDTREARASDAAEKPRSSHNHEELFSQAMDLHESISLQLLKTWNENHAPRDQPGCSESPHEKGRNSAAEQGRGQRATAIVSESAIHVSRDGTNLGKTPTLVASGPKASPESRSPLRDVRRAPTAVM